MHPQEPIEFIIIGNVITTICYNTLVFLNCSGAYAPKKGITLFQGLFRI